jgi:glucose/arabinose dehydrogenase
MKYKFLILLILGVFLTLGAFNTIHAQQQAQSPDPQFTVLAKNLEIPWALSFLPDGNILFTERTGKIKLLNMSNNQVTVITTIPNVVANGESGLLGLAIDPQYTSNHFVFIYYTTTGPKNKVERYTFQNNQLTGQVTIIDNIPANTYHNGGRLRFGPDGFLYVTTGDSGNDSTAQDTNAIAGKILRITRDGQPAPGNPFNNLVYSYGHRNPQGLAWDGNTLYETEHGPSQPSCCDEINRIEPGKNYGWPTVQGDNNQPGLVKNLLNSGQSGDTTWAPSGTAFLNGYLWYAGLRGEALYQAKIEGDKATITNQFFKHKFGRIRDVVVGPDNQLYITSSNMSAQGGTKQAEDDKIYKVQAGGDPTPTPLPAYSPNLSPYIFIIPALFILLTIFLR